MEIFNERPRRRPRSASLPITLILLVLAFGTLVAAGIPLLLAITGVVGTMGLVGRAQPAVAGRGVDQPRDPAHRPGRGRRLRAVLPAPGARGARRRTQQGSGHRGGRGHLRPRGARLRHHGHDRDGRHVLRRSRDVHLVRHRHHRGRRRRDARIAHGAPGRAVDARRPDREGPDSRPRPSPQPGGPHRHLVAHRGPGAAPPAAVGRAWPPACSWPWRSPALADGHRHPEHLGIAAAGPAGRADVQPPPGGVPVRDLVPERRHQGQGRDGARGRRPGWRSSSRPRREHQDAASRRRAGAST